VPRRDEVVRAVELELLSHLGLTWEQLRDEGEEVRLGAERDASVFPGFLALVDPGPGTPPGVGVGLLSVLAGRAPPALLGGTPSRAFSMGAEPYLEQLDPARVVSAIVALAHASARLARGARRDSPRPALPSQSRRPAPSHASTGSFAPPLLARVRVLREAALFRLARLHGVVELAHLAVEVELPAGQEAVLAPDTLAIVADGAVRTVDGFSSVARGALVGGAKALAGESMVALAPVGARLVTLTTSALFDCIDEHPEVGRSVLALVAEEVVEARLAALAPRERGEGASRPHASQPRPLEALRRAAG
jgi:hypothetical protein